MMLLGEDAIKQWIVAGRMLGNGKDYQATMPWSGDTASARRKRTVWWCGRWSIAMCLGRSECQLRVCYAIDAR